MRDTAGNFMWTLVLCVQIYTLEECLYMKTEGTHQNGTSTLLPCACPRAWVVGCSLVGIPPRCAFVFQSNVEELHQALSIIHLTCHHCNPPNPREAAGAGLQAETPEVWTVRTWMEGKPQQRERERMTGDEQGWVWKERSGGRVDDEEAEGWQVIVAEGVTEMAGRRKDEQALIFYTRRFLYTWREASDSKLSCSPYSFCHCLCLVWMRMES